MLLPLHTPVLLAEDYSMVDVLSGGRLDFGVGRGLYKYDYEMSDVDMAERRPRFDECLSHSQGLVAGSIYPPWSLFSV